MKQATELASRRPQNMPAKVTQTKPSASTGLTRRPEYLPATTDTISVPVLPIADIASKPLPEFEAELALGLDRIMELGEIDPLASLDALIAAGAAFVAKNPQWFRDQVDGAEKESC